MVDAISKMPYNGRRKSRNIKNDCSCNVQSRDGTQELNLKKLARLVQVAIRFHPGLQKTKPYTCSRGIVVRKVILNRTEPLFQGFLSFQCMFVLK